MSPKMAQILDLLRANTDKPLTWREIEREIWSDLRIADKRRVIMVYIYRLRKLGYQITAPRGRASGYLLVGEPEGMALS